VMGRTSRITKRGAHRWLFQSTNNTKGNARSGSPGDGDHWAFFKRTLSHQDVGQERTDPDVDTAS